MKKDAYYFPHFSNARHDRKLKRVIKEFGIEGYGIYFMLLEVLRDQPEMKYPLSDVDLLADEFRTSEPKINTIIANYGLFEVDKLNMFFSPKLEEYLEPYFKMKKQRIEAGKASAEKRKNKSLEQKNERPFNDRSTTDEQSKVKESKVKGSKVKESINIPFSEFWDLYDKKVGDKNKCEKKWKSLKPGTREKIMEVLPDWKKQITDKQFQPYPQTYLNQERWNDEIIKKKGYSLLKIEDNEV